MRQSFTHTLTAFVFCICLYPARAQDSLPTNDTLKKNLPQKVFFGFSFGSLTHLVKNAELDIYHAEALDGLPDTIRNMSVHGRGGLYVALLMEVRLNKKFFARFNPGIGFDSHLSYEYDDPYGRRIKVKPIELLDFPLGLIYKISEKKTRPFVSAGINWRMLVRRNEDGPMNFFATSLGAGLERKIGRFIVCPELRYSIGLNQVLINRLSNSIPTLTDRMKLHSFWLVLNLKG
jgi:hypothetical protein